MKISLLIAVLIFSFAAHASNKDIYIKLQTYFNNAPRAVTLDEIPWANEASTKIKCAGIYQDGKEIKTHVLVKWILKKTPTPGTGPLFPPEEPTSEIKVNLCFGESCLNLNKNENVFNDTSDEWKIEGRDLIISQIAVTQYIRTDGTYIFYSEVYNSVMSYGYCWKK